MLLNKLVTNIYIGMCAYLEVIGLYLEFLDLFMKVKYAQMPRREEIHKFYKIVLNL